jgi:hypothetical protein
VRRYLGRAKESEARATVRAISLALTRHLESLPAARRRMPASAPPTPAQVPRGQKSVVPESAWQHPTWKAIGFSIADPVYFSYQIITARGGRRATVRATGDLDGDGIESRYSLELQLDAAGKVVASPELVIENELE